MSKTIAPLLSFDARGQIAKTQVYSVWKGRPYVRRYVIPSNPDTAEQQLTRTVFAFLNALWRYFPGSAVAAWEAYANTSRFTARNGWLKQNNGTLREETDLNNIVLSPSANGGIIAAAMALTAGVDTITVVLTAPDLPSGWTIASAYAVAVRDQDPHSGTLYQMTAGSDASSPYSIPLTPLVTGEIYQVGGWFSFTKPDGTLAYGQALVDQETPT